MSKLADAIKRVSRKEAAPLGFAAARSRTPSATLLCIARLSSGEAKKIGEAASKGADAVIIEGIDPGKLNDPAKDAGQLPLGVQTSKANKERVAALGEAGADFVVADLESAMADALLDEGVGLVLAIGNQHDDTTLRLLGDLGLDALIVPAPSGPLTMSRLLELRRIASLARTPLLIPVDSDADATRLQSLREAGAAGVVLDGASGVDRLRDTIASLPARGRKRQERTAAVLPAQAAVAPDGHDDDDDED